MIITIGKKVKNHQTCETLVVSDDFLFSKIAFGRSKGLSLKRFIECNRGFYLFTSPLCGVECPADLPSEFRHGASSFLVEKLENHLSDFHMWRLFTFLFPSVVMFAHTTSVTTFFGFITDRGLETNFARTVW